MNPEIASLITDLDLFLYSYEKAVFYQTHKFDFAFQLGSLTSIEAPEGFDCGDWAGSVSTGSIARFSQRFVRSDAESYVIDNVFSQGDESYIQQRDREPQQRIMENHYRLRYRDCNSLAGVLDRVSRQLNLFEDGTA